VPNLTIHEKGAESLHKIDGDRVTLGRAPHNDIQIHDGHASKEHCLLVLRGDRWKLIDLESHNGTRVNRVFKNQAWLGHDDTIRIGETELRFGLEGSARKAATRPPRVAVSAAAPSARPPSRPARDEPEDDYAPPPPSRPSKSAGEKFLIFGGAALGLVITMWIVVTQGGMLAQDSYNEKVRREANRLVGNGEWDEAIAYLEEHSDPSGNAYDVNKRRIAELERNKPDYKKTMREAAARRVLSRMANKIANYNRGGSADPQYILELMNRLKTEYAGTEQDALAAQNYPAFYAGRVPEPGVNTRNPLRKTKKEWEAICEKADDYRKQEHFREARETLIKFVRVREATLNEVQLDYLNRELEKRVNAIDHLARTYFSSVERRANGFVKNSRFDQAIQLYRNVIANYGIDKLARKAKEAIADIEQKKAEAGPKGG